MTLQGLYIHTADVQTMVPINNGGRIDTAWERVMTIPCRLSQPQTSKITIIDSTIQPRDDAVIFASEDNYGTIKGLKLPVRYVVPDGEWAGTYVSNKPPRLYAQTVHASHIEIDVQRVIT